MTQRGPSKTYKGSEFRHFGCSLTSCVMTWWGHIVERWCLCQDARLQDTKHGCITNQTSLFTYQSERKEKLEATDVLCVQRSTKQSKIVNSAKDKDLPKRAKTVYWCKSCEVLLCIASGNENCFELYHSKVQFWR